MLAQEYTTHDATALAELVRRGEVTPLELVDAAIERIEALNATLNAVVEKGYAAARAGAASAVRSAPLGGVPFLAKDMNIEVAGLHLTASCRALASLPAATVDAPLAARWREAGLAILGRTNTPEWAGEFVTEPTWRGPTRNPWDLARSPGGSSGGAAAAVASGMVPIAHGTDSGGSIRVPAAACGLVGLKPSRGWVPVGPHHDELAGGFDCEHVLTRSVRDSALMLDLTASPEPTSRYPWRTPEVPFVRALAGALPRLRIGLALRAPGGLAPADAIGAAVEDIASHLARAGHQLVPFEYPEGAGIAEAGAVIWMTAIAEEIDYWSARLGRLLQPEELEALTRASIEAGNRWSAVDYVRARRAATRATGAMALSFESIDVLLLPTTATLPPLTGTIDGRTNAFSLERWNELSYQYAPYTELFNITGQPAISLPLAEAGVEGLPIGVQFAAPLGHDARLLNLAAWLERERPWAGRLATLRQRLAAQVTASA